MSKTKTVKRTDNIEKMDFDQLRKAVQLLRDDVDLWKRKYEDAIQNLDEDNFGKSFTFTQNRMKAQIKVNAQEISTKITAEDLGGALVNYSTISQTADAIQTAVVSVNNATDEKLENYSTIEQTADAITATVTSEYVTNLIGSDIVTTAKLEAELSVSADKIKSYVSENYETQDDAANAYDSLYTEIWQTADSITSIVSKNVSAYFEKTTRPTASNTTAVEKSMLCLYDGTYYYFNDVTNTWKTYPASGITTMFKQTSSGFELTGDVSISGDLITDGTITGTSLQTPKDRFNSFVRVNASNSSLEFLLNDAVVARWITTDMGYTTLAPVGGGHLILGNSKPYAENGGDIIAQGNWDFDGADVTGLSAIAVFG